MKIAILHSSLTAMGGGERFVLQAAQEWGKRHDVTVYAWDYDAKKTFPGFGKVKVKKVGVPGGAVAKLARWSSLKFDADVLSAHGFPSHFAAIRNPATVYYLHIVPGFFAFAQSGGHGKKLYGNTISTFDKIAAKKCASIVANGKMAAGWAKSQYHRKIEVINPGIDSREFSSGAYGKYALCVSRLVPEKRIGELIGEWNEAASGGLELVVVGTGDSHYATKLMEAAKGKKVKMMTGGVSDAELKRLYSRARCVVLPPHNEPFGIVLLEAMASERPVIAHASGGPLEIVSGGAGVLFKNDAEMMAAVRKFANSTTIASRMGRAGKKRVQAQFSVSKQLAKLEKMLVAAAKSKGGRKK